MPGSSSAVNRERYERFVQWGRELNSDELSQAWAQITENWSADRSDLIVSLIAALRLDEQRVLDTAAEVAAQHRALTQVTTDVRALLAICASQDDLSRQLAGDPRNVIDDVKRKLMNRAGWRGEAMAIIWREPMLEARVAAVALGAKPSNREKASQYRKRSWLLGLPAGRGYLYPEFQFDPARSDIYPAVRTVNEVLNAVGDPWGAASWWYSSHAGLQARPADLVGTEPASRPDALADRERATNQARHWEEDLVSAAQAVVEPVG